jgi:hypothetical protein
MKSKHKIYRPLPILFSIWLCFLPILGYSQVTGSCAEKLKDAQTLFEKGQVEQVPSMLSECLKSGFTREESLSAYKLLIQSYIFEEKQDLADSTMLAFLKTNPEYQISPTDHSSFVHLYNNFKVKSVVQITLHFGTSLPFLTGITTRSASGEPVKPTYSSKALNLYGSLEARFVLTKKMDLSLEAGFSQLSFTRVESFLGYNSNKYIEIQQRIELPVTLTYNFRSFGKLTPFARFGFGPALTLSTSAKPTGTPIDVNNLIGQTGSDLDRKTSRISMDLFSQVGGGVKFKTRGGYLSAEIRSNLGFFDQTIRVEDAATGELGNFYHQVDDDFHLNAVNFSIGYTRIFYKPSKRKE